ncbi:MAG TPA: transcription-repair coupling factor, partial [Hymenobacter sp.]
MKASEFIQLYRHDPDVLHVASALKAAPTDAALRLHVRGLVGSQDAVLAMALHKLQPEQHHLYILHDRDEASFFLADLQHLLGNDHEPLLFPSSYKRAYSFDETENANVLMRAEALNQLNTKGKLGQLIVTYPEALTEKVINRQSLV